MTFTAFDFFQKRIWILVSLVAQVASILSFFIALYNLFEFFQVLWPTDGLFSKLPDETNKKLADEITQAVMYCLLSGLLLIARDSALNRLKPQEAKVKI